MKLYQEIIFKMLNIRGKRLNRLNQYDSIFRDYYLLPPFEDRFQKDGEEGVTIIIPTIHNNEMWKANLYSIFREIPVAELIIGDGGVLMTHLMRQSFQE